MVSVPNTEFFHVMTVQTLLTMNDVGEWLLPCGGYSISEKRNFSVKRFLDSDCTHLLFIDADMMPGEDTIKALLRHDVPIVSGIALMSREPHEPAVFDDDGVFWNFDGKLHKVRFVGMSNCLIEREVCERMDEPWFDDGVLDRGGGEDKYFCDKAFKLGFGVYVDTSFLTPHMMHSYALGTKAFAAVRRMHKLSLDADASTLVPSSK